jgi:diaminopimelate epimerase
MKSIKFTKTVASGNDFVVIDNLRAIIKNRAVFAKGICDRKYGVGADGLLLLEKTRVADVKMRIFNADGSEAEMCGNGARCFAFWLAKNRKTKTGNLNIETKAGIIKSFVGNENVRINLTDPKNIKLGIIVALNKRNIRVNFIDTGVPHAVIFVDGLDNMDVNQIGSSVRYHHKFSPRGTNADFVEVLNDNTISVRTYERGVEVDTLACGTGSVASALIFALKTGTNNVIKVRTRSGEVLKVLFKKSGNNFHDVWLEGKARIVHKGEYYV